MKRQRQEKGARSHRAVNGDQGAFLPGRNPLRELLRASPESIRTLYTAQQQASSRERDALIEEVRRAGIPVEIIPIARLDELARGAVHQSFVAEIKPRESLQLHELLERAAAVPRATLLFLDGIQDPHNLGAIFRAAECFGVSGIVWSRNRGVSITPVVRKVSVGATELVPYAIVGNLAESLRKAKDEGFWVVTTELGDGSTELAAYRPPERVALVLGSEGEGVQQLVRSLADHKVRIPMKGVVDSLNVSQATAVLLYALSQGGFTA